MAQLNDLLVMGQSTLLGPLTVRNNTTIYGHLYANNGLTWTNVNWIAPGNVTCTASTGGSEFSFDMGAGTQWHVWSTPKGNSIFSCWADDQKCKAFGALEVAGATTLSSTLGVTGATTLSSTLTVAGNITASGTGTQDFSAGTLKFDTINIPTSSSGTTYGTGTSGQVLKANGSGTVYWGSDSNTTYTFSTGDAQGQIKIDPSNTSATNYSIKDLSSTSSPTFAAVKIGDNGMLGTGSTINTLICESAINTHISADAQAVWLGSRGNTDSTETSGVCFDGGTIKFWCPGDSNVLFIDSDSSATALSYVGITAASYNAASDARLKTHLQTFSITKSILDLPIYKYDFINGAKNQIGCMAQDLQQICPEIVHEDDKGYLSIQESKIVYLLIDEIKKLRREIDELRRD